MRIVCPNCDAQYEVPTSVIPQEGRDVECSNCGKTWLQHHPDHMPDEQDSVAATPDLSADPDRDDDGDDDRDDDRDDDGVGDETPIPNPAPKPRPRRDLDPGVADILREEAAREQAARKAGALEVQTDLNLDGPAQPRPAQDNTPPAPLPPPIRRPLEPATAEQVPLREPTSRRELLPDIEEINSTLRSAGDRDAAGGDLSPDAPRNGQRKRSFRRGFVLSVALVAIGSLVYVFKPDIVAAVPQLEPTLDSYTAAVDDARLWLNVQMTALAHWLSDQAAASGQ